MTATVDTNVLVRGVVGDDRTQAEAAAALLREADELIVGIGALCEFVWVLRRTYKLSRADVAAAVHALVATANVSLDRPAVAAGLAVLAAGGDFADGVIALEGKRFGGDVFASFDRKAVKTLSKLGYSTRLLRGATILADQG